MRPNWVWTAVSTRSSGAKPRVCEQTSEMWRKKAGLLIRSEVWSLSTRVTSHVVHAQTLRHRGVLGRGSVNSKALLQVRQTWRFCARWHHALPCQVVRAQERRIFEAMQRRFKRTTMHPVCGGIKAWVVWRRKACCLEVLLPLRLQVSWCGVVDPLI